MDSISRTVVYFVVCGRDQRNIVAVRLARLELGWVNLETENDYWYVTNQPGKLSLAIPAWIRES